MTKLDKRRKYYLILDCETATLPYAAKFPADMKKNVAIAKPLIYDLGWQIVDIRGKVYKRASYLISEIFSVPAVFNTAYYASKRPIYLERLKNKEITLADWNTAVAELIEDLDAVEAVGAYNSMFDFKKAIPFTELYVSKLYSPDFLIGKHIKMNDVKQSPTEASPIRRQSLNLMFSASMAKRIRCLTCGVYLVNIC